ncbi:LysR family transcriptional regulator [Dactylosporangium vinaceum]|uniref:LysR family transcriptional regulator n=1 Tax=Dactylosporangium vinaceum TaxID=53362 RepID=A0ABV5MBA2_9ACTN|nr:LysR family transcriptional regulator [Dactylosporangium vinaceum]UAB98349.1 LysR family transcriptional regulator [Dactylosporangium vinaceum]
MLDPWRLKLLADLAALGTVRAVAQAAHLSPSTVSQQLAVLEREAGARLFERAGRRLRLTEAGRTLARHARTILDQMETARAELAGLDATGRLTIGAFTSAVNTFVVAAIHRLRSTAPGLRVDLRELDPTEGVPALRRGACDVAVTADLFDGTAPVDADVIHTPLTTDRVVLVTAATTSRVADLPDFADALWSAERPGSWTHDLITRAGRRAGFEPDLTALFSSYGPLLAHVEAGLSVTLLPELAVDARYNVTAHPLRDPLERRITAAVRASSVTRPAIATAVAALRAAAPPPAP